MKGMRRWHPIAVVVFALGAVGITVFTRHPILLGLSLAGSILACLTSDDPPSLRGWAGYAVFWIAVAAVNPLFSPGGVTVLFRVGTFRYTAEAVLYGGIMGMALTAALLWFRALGTALTAEGFTAVFGKRLPRLTLGVSMALGLVPRLIRQGQEIRRARRCMGLPKPRGKRELLAVFTALTELCTEQGVGTVRSMEARGYGLPGRTAFHPRRFTFADGVRCGVCGLLGAAVLVAPLYGLQEFVCYPHLSGVGFSAGETAAYATMALLSFLPVFGWAEEVIRWKRSRSKT